MQREVPPHAARQRLPLPKVQRLELLEVLPARTHLSTQVVNAHSASAVGWAYYCFATSSGATAPEEVLSSTQVELEQVVSRRYRMPHLTRYGGHIGQVRPMAGAVAVQESRRVRRWQHDLRRLGPATRAGPSPGHRLACTAPACASAHWSVCRRLRADRVLHSGRTIAAAWRTLPLLHANRMALAILFLHTETLLFSDTSLNCSCGPDCPEAADRTASRRQASVAARSPILAGGLFHLSVYLCTLHGCFMSSVLAWLSYATGS